MKQIVLILDAMGVIYQSADDVAELLVPFVQERGGTKDVEAIEQLYASASLGQLTAEEFWEAVGVTSTAEDNFLARHKLSDGLMSLLENLPSSVVTVWCLSNDVSQWSRKLREQHLLTKHIAGFVISGDVGFRKPDPRIYHALLNHVGRPAGDYVFVDDRIKNLDAALALGFQTVWFCRNSDERVAKHLPVRSFAGLADYLAKINGISAG